MIISLVFFERRKKGFLILRIIYWYYIYYYYIISYFDTSIPTYIHCGVYDLLVSCQKQEDDQLNWQLEYWLNKEFPETEQDKLLFILFYVYIRIVIVSCL